MNLDLFVIAINVFITVLVQIWILMKVFGFFCFLVFEVESLCSQTYSMGCCGKRCALYWGSFLHSVIPEYDLSRECSSQNQIGMKPETNHSEINIQTKTTKIMVCNQISGEFTNNIFRRIRIYLS